MKGGREGKAFTSASKPNQSPQCASTAEPWAGEDVSAQYTAPQQRQRSGCRRKDLGTRPTPAVTLQSGREGLPPSMAHRSNGASASASIAVPRAKPTSSASAATKTSANKPLRNRCQWVGGSEGGWRAAGVVLTKLTPQAIVASAFVDYVHQHTTHLQRAVPALHHGPECRRVGTTRLGTPAARPSCRNLAAAESSVLRSALALVRPHRITEGSQYGVTAGYDGVAVYGRAYTARRKGTAPQPRADARRIQGYLW